ncbi:MAG: hypothetical protein D6766_11230, partial [Verrucomicrobia bacterium]
MKSKRQPAEAAGNPPGPEAETPAPKASSPKRRWMFRLAAVVGVPVAVLGLIEAGLRLAGHGFPTSFFQPVQQKGGRFWTANDRFGWRFFPPEVARLPAPVRFPADKGADTWRIFVFGESAALGDPAPGFGFSRYLEALLEERFPKRRFEVINVAMTAINSHVIREIARDCADKQGDLWILYLGNNEYYGPFGAEAVSGPSAPPLWMVRLRLALLQTRLGQAVAGLGRALRERFGGGPAAWAGLRMFEGREIPPDDPRRQRVHQHFAANLEAILRTGLDAGAHILVAGMAVNLRDCPPFASSHAPSLGPEKREAWSQRFAEIARRQDAGETNVLADLRRLFEENPVHAEACFRLARAEAAAGHAAQAAELFRRARDLDALPVRADSALRDLSREMAEAHRREGVGWCDAEAGLGEGEPLGLPGAESFYEHVHLTFDGNYRLARFVAERVLPLLPEAWHKEAAADWASREVCERRLALTDWSRAAALENMLGRMAGPPYDRQIGARQRLERLALRLAEVRARQDPVSQLEAAALYQQALQRRPDDPFLLEAQAQFLEATGDLAGAAADWEKLTRLLPGHPGAWYQHGRLLAKLDRREEARHALERALELHPWLADAWLELASLDVGDRRLEDALRRCDAALRLQPGRAKPHVRRADILARMDRRDEALRELQEAVRVEPNDWEARYLLGMEYAMTDKIPEAEKEFAAAARLRPGHVLTHVNLGVALAKQGKLDEA